MWFDLPAAALSPTNTDKPESVKPNLIYHQVRRDVIRLNQIYTLTKSFLRYIFRFLFVMSEMSLLNVSVCELMSCNVFFSRHKSWLLYPTLQFCSLRRAHSDAKLKDPFSLAQKDLTSLYDDIKKVRFFIKYLVGTNWSCTSKWHRNYSWNKILFYLLLCFTGAVCI